MYDMSLWRALQPHSNCFIISNIADRMFLGLNYVFDASPSPIFNTREVKPQCLSVKSTTAAITSVNMCHSRDQT